MAEALRLADALEDDLVDYSGQSLPRISQDIADNAAAELRRLHAENERLQEQRDVLLLECIDIVALHGGSVEIEAAIRAKMEQPE